MPIIVRPIPIGRPQDILTMSRRVKYRLTSCAASFIALGRSMKVVPTP
jgi:hypothetical protein